MSESGSAPGLGELGRGSSVVRALDPRGLWGTLRLRRIPGLDGKVHESGEGGRSHRVPADHAPPISWGSSGKGRKDLSVGSPEITLPLEKEADFQLWLGNLLPHAPKGQRLHWG